MQRDTVIDTTTADWIAAVFAQPQDSAWVLTAGKYDRAREGDVEAQYAVSNGFLGVRAALEQPTDVSHPRTYVAGLFDQAPGSVITSVLLSTPNWLQFHVRVNGAPLSLEAGEILDQRRTLDLHRARLLHDLRWRSSSGDIVRLQTVRFASLAQRALAVQLARLTVEQPSHVSLETYIEAAQPPLQQLQLDGGMGIWRTAQSHTVLAMTHDHTLSLGDQVLRATVHRHGLRWEWQAAAAQPATLIRFITAARSKHEAQSRAAVAAMRQHALTQGTHALYAAHTRAWQERWHASDVLIAGDERAQQVLRFAVYHLIGAANPDDDRVSVGARALTGDGYHGHVFWDTEIFLLPFYTFTWPEAARAMLGYRYHTLPAARAKAARLGYRGAFYAWESADTGEEATPRGVIGPDGKEVVFRVATEETHINADIAYAVWHYWLATGDDAFLRDAGAEIVLETARFWASRATLDDDRHYHIRKVIGPDEYHNGVDDNAYTNVMAQWNLERGIEVAQLLQQRWPEQWVALQQRIALASDELQQWADVAERLLTGFDPQRGLYEQFAGFFELEYLNLQRFTPRTPYMDVALGLDRMQHTQVIKQADVVMLLALLWDRFSPAVRAANFDYYAPRCSQGSSLSPAMHALVAARLGAVDVAQRYFGDAVAVDLGDTMGNAAQGVHIATLGGLWQAVVFGFAGMRADTDGLHFAPHLPPAWQTLQFRVQWRGKRLQISLQSEPLTFTGLLEQGDTLPLTVGDLRQVLRKGMAWTWVWDKQAQRWTGAS